jgi:hypothetical protein
VEKIEDDDSVSCVYGATQNVLKLKSDGTDVAASRSTAGDTTAGGAAAKRKRRDTDTDVDTDITVGEKNVEPEPATEASSSGGDQPETAKAQRKQGVELNCSSARCVEIKCTITDLKPGRTYAKVIKVKSVLWKASLLLDYPSVSKLTVVSKAEVVFGQNASYITDSNPFNNDHSTYTILIPAKPPISKEKIAVWQIGLAVAAGVILLTLMIFGLYKVGFFRRSRIDDSSNGANEKLIKGSR